MGLFDQAFHDQVGPPWDAVCGTDGMSTDLNAVVAAGHTRIVLGPGAVLTANLTLSAGSGYIWSPFGPRGINLGARRIIVTGADWRLEGFRLNAGNGGALLEFQGTSQLCTVRDVALTGGSSHGIYFNTSGNDHVVEGCYITGNGGDGINVIAGAGAVRVVNNFIYNNTGYGLNTAATDGIVVANRLDTNGSGAINGSPAVDVGNKKT
jgi:hypothetical protein